ncbi:MAG: hypothetical protein ABI171_14795 [Collimonas sp.]|uniref:hypothetical protein n=1 Tax=Collimonas sp. TaxID=1963772 RepID=UPI003263D5F7
MSLHATDSNLIQQVAVNLNTGAAPTVVPEVVSVNGLSAICYWLDPASIACGYYFAGYMDNTAGTGSQLVGSSIENGTGYRLNDFGNLQGQISVTLFIRNSINPKVTVNYDPEIVNNHC